jgi:hypothetical protein
MPYLYPNRKAVERCGALGRAGLDLAGLGLAWLDLAWKENFFVSDNSSCTLRRLST